MTIFYHLSHFFEFLSGVYFGGFALLGFLQDDATSTFNALLNNRKKAALNAKTLVGEYYKININGLKGPGNALRSASKWMLWSNCEKYINTVFNLTNKYITKTVDHKGIFLKKFFPSFFYTGLFCISIVLYSGYEEICNNKNCIKGIDDFFLHYCLCSIIFQVWALFIFPILVNKVDYFKLIIINGIICLAMLIFTVYYTLHPGLFFGFNLLLLSENANLLILVALLIALLPLIYIFILSASILILWLISNFFYFITLKMYSKDMDISNDIRDLNEK